MTIMEVLQNAKYNVGKGLYGNWKANCPDCASGVITLGLDQLENAIKLLEKGYGLYDDFEAVTQGYEQIDAVPEKEE